MQGCKTAKYVSMQLWWNGEEKASAFREESINIDPFYLKNKKRERETERNKCMN